MQLKKSQQKVLYCSQTPFHTACAFGQIQVAEFLLSVGASLTAADNKGHSALHVAAQQGGLATVQYLIEKGLDINIKNNGGQVVLCAFIYLFLCCHLLCNLSFNAKI